ncbi:MAG: hypothetical protein AB8H80_16795 [Planctomycetota bacterium]
MNTVTIVLLAIAGISLVVWLGVLSHRARLAHLAACEEFAAELDLTFSTERLGSVDSSYPQFRAFDRGDDRYAYDTFRGNRELFGRACPIFAGEYHYETKDSDGDRSSSRFSFALVELPFATATIELRRESVFDKMAAAVGFDDIDFESHEFSRKYFVKSDDKKFAYDVLHPRMIEFLLAENIDTFEIRDGVLLLGNGSGSWKLEEFRRRIAFAEAFCELWPRHLLAAAGL